MEILCIITYRKTSVLWFFFSKIGGCRPKTQLKKELHHRKFLFLVNIFSRRRWDHKFSTNYDNNDRNQFFFITDVKTLNFLTFYLEPRRLCCIYTVHIHTFYAVFIHFYRKDMPTACSPLGGLLCPHRKKRWFQLGIRCFAF